MSEFDKLSTDGGATFMDVEDSKAVHWSEAKGYVGKNLIPFPYSNTSRTAGGITLTANADGTVSSNNATATAECFFDLQTGIVNTFANGTYTLNGCPENQNNKMEIQIRFRLIAGQNSANDLVYRDYGSGVTFTLANTSNYPEVYIGCAVRNGYNPSNKVFKPMLRLSSISDSTYEPYITPNTDLMSYADNSILGAKNLLKYPYPNTTKTVGGITFTDNGDGSITINGTATEYVFFDLHQRTQNDIFPQYGTYILSGGYSSKCQLYLQNRNSSDTGWETEQRDTGNGVIISRDSNKKYAIELMVVTGFVADNITIRPMLRLASDTDDTFAPYAMTNKELTDKVVGIINAAKNSADYAAFKTAMNNL